MALRRRWWWWRLDRRRRERRVVAIVFLGFRVLRGFGVFGNLGSIVGQAIDSIEIERERERERDLSSQLRPPEDSCHSSKKRVFCHGLNYF